ncbi:MAG: ABC transporter permease [Christensenellales bacterium]
MIKYIVKRLLLSLLILFGVSIIIYSLARMMPTDYVDQQYSSAVSQGTMQQEDVDRIKELYGLAMPDAFLYMNVGENSKYAGMKFVKNTKEDTYENVCLGPSVKTYDDWYEGSYDGKDDTRLYLYKKDSSGVYRFAIGKVIARGMVADEDLGEDAVIKMDEVFVPEENGTYYVEEIEGDYATIRNVVFTLSSGETVNVSVDYNVANGWNKFTAILKGYFGWLGNMLKGDFGMSFKYKKPVADVIVQNMGISFAIAFIATILQFVIAIPLGIKAAVNQYGVVDYTVTVFAMIGISLPTFFLAALFIRLFAVQLGWFEVGGIASASLPMDASWIVRLGDMLWHMVLPMTVLVILSIGSLMRYTRTNTLEALNADYVRTARAKGLSERTVIYKHAFRNTMIPLVTMMAGILPSLFGGAMITETVFSIPGIGKLAYDALVVADIPFIMGYNMFIAVLTVIGTLLSDLMYAVVDPRVKLGK